MIKRLVPVVVLGGLVAAVVCWRAIDKPRSARRDESIPAGKKAAAGVIEQPAERAGKGQAGDESIANGKSAVRALTPVVARLRRSLSNEKARGKLSPQVIETFLESRARSASSLLVAYQESGNTDYLDEAAQRFPTDSRVQIALLATDLPEDQRAAAIARFKLAAPDNPLANYYAAQEAFRQKDLRRALDELAQADGKAGYDDYMLPQVEEREKLFLAAGLSPLEAQVHASVGATMPYLRVVNEMRSGLTAELEALTKEGDMQTALQLGASGVAAARQIEQGPGSRIILNGLVSIAMERQVLKAMAPAQATTLLQQPVAERLAELQQRRDEITDLVRSADVTDSDVSTEEFVRYFEIMNGDGEMAALRWLDAQLP